MLRVWTRIVKFANLRLRLFVSQVAHNLSNKEAKYTMEKVESLINNSIKYNWRAASMTIRRRSFTTCENTVFKIKKRIKKVE